MSFSAWDRGRGDRQLRVVEPIGFEQTGDAAFVLGSDTPGVFERIAINDFVHVLRPVDLSGQSFVRARFRLRGAESFIPGPPDHYFFLSITVDYEDVVTARVPQGRTREVADLAAPVSKLFGTHIVGFKLELTAI